MKKIISLILASLFVFTVYPTNARIDTDSDTIFNWAEALFPKLLSPANAKSANFEQFYFRFYPDTNLYVGIDDTDNAFLFDGVNMTPVGKVSDFLASAQAFSANNGKCVTIPSPAGKKIVFKQSVKDISGLQVIDITTEYLTATDSKEVIKETTQTTANNQADFPIITSSTQENNYIVNSNLRSLTTQKTSITISIPGLLLDGVQVSDSTTTETSTFTPARLEGPFKELCQGQTWETSAVEQASTLNGQISTTPLAGLKGKISVINTPKNTTAGTFNTVQIEINSADSTDPTASKILQWIDTVTGLTVFSEAISKNGTSVTREAKTIQ